MDARQIMNNDAMWGTWDITALDCDYAIIRATDRADWRESGVQVRENTLNAWGIMSEAMK